QFIEALLDLNRPERSGDSPRAVVRAPTDGQPLRWRMVASASAGVRTYNRVVVAPSADGAFANLGAAVEAPAARAAACTVVRLALTESHLAWQQELHDLGFQLSAVRPPTETPPADDGEFEGMWSRPRPDLFVGEPYYFGSRLPSG